MSDIPRRVEKARECVHGNIVWWGHECGECDAAGTHVWRQTNCAYCGTRPGKIGRLFCSSDCAAAYAVQGLVEAQR